MVVRKRQREESSWPFSLHHQEENEVQQFICPTSSSSCSTVEAAAAMTAARSPRTPTTNSISIRRQRRQQRCRSLRFSAISWKMVLTTYFLWVCGDHHRYYSTNNSNNHQQQPLPSSSSSSSSPSPTIFAHAWGSSSSSNNATITKTKKGLQIVSACSKQDFQVQAVYLVCDSPGAYYRGSSSYRDSATCIYGDKARLQLQCK